MVEVLKQNWIFIVIVGLSFFLLLNITPQILTFVGSLLLLDFSYDVNTRAATEFNINKHSLKYFGLRLVQLVLVLAALLLFKYYCVI